MFNQYSIDFRYLRIVLYGYPYLWRHQTQLLGLQISPISWTSTCFTSEGKWKFCFKFFLNKTIKREFLLLYSLPVFIVPVTFSAKLYETFARPSSTVISKYVELCTLDRMTVLFCRVRNCTTTLSTSDSGVELVKTADEWDSLNVTWFTPAL